MLYVPKLSYNLPSVSKALEAGKSVMFDSSGCEILNGDNKVIAFATRVGNLYCLEFCRRTQHLNVVEKEGNERLWHRQYGHLGEQSLQKLAKKKLVDRFDYDMTSNIGFCEPCIGSKHHRSHFETSTSQTKEPLELVHSDMCGKRNQ